MKCNIYKNIFLLLLHTKEGKKLKKLPSHKMHSVLRNCETKHDFEVVNENKILNRKNETHNAYRTKRHDFKVV